MASSSLKHFDFTSKKPLTNVEAVLNHSALTPDLLKLNKLPEAIKRDLKKNKPKERELPPEVLTDLKVLRMRSAIDAKRFYKRSSLKHLSSNDVQVGKVIDSPADFYSSRLTKKERKRTLVDELLADQDFKKEVKKRYIDIVMNNKKKFNNHYRHIQREERAKERRNKKEDGGSKHNKKQRSKSKNGAAKNISKEGSKKNK